MRYFSSPTRKLFHGDDASEEGDEEEDKAHPTKDESHDGEGFWPKKWHHFKGEMGLDNEKHWPPSESHPRPDHVHSYDLYEMLEFCTNNLWNMHFNMF